MTFLNRRDLFYSLGAASVVLTTPAAFAQTSWRKCSFKELAKIAESRVAEGRAVGICLGASAPGFRKMDFFGTEDIQSAKLISSKTQFRIASVTKPVTAACILDLCERDALSLDARLEAFFPDFPAAQEITVYDLLAHTSGLANWWGRLPEGAPQDFMDRPKPHLTLAQMREPFLFAPGSMRSYSNSGYVLLGEIIEQVTGAAFDDWLRDELLSRCGASGITLERTGETSPNWAEGYLPGPDRA